ncbi:MAG TPA: FGGY-family carbohydrate kinase [Actinopolymorphaceae bacterium]
MTADEFLLGIDAGQTVTKACVFDRHGRERGRGSARVTVHSPHPRWVERDMEEVWQATVTAVQQAVADAGVEPGSVKAIGIVGHNDGLYLVDEGGTPVRAAVTAMDTRAHDILGQWRASPMWPRALEVTGQVPYAASPSTLLAWFLHHQPDVLTNTRWVLFCKDWLRFRLTDAIATDPSEASAAFTSVRTQAYAQEALALYGLEFLADKLPPIQPSHAIAGEVSETAATVIGIPAGTPVVTGAHDVDGSAIGTGVVRPGMLSIAAGTFSINQIISDHVVVDERWQARSFVEPGYWLNMSTSPSSATNLDWWCRVFGLEPGESAYETLAAEATQALGGPSTLVYHPFLYGSPYGEMPSASLFGLRGWHTRPELVRAILEGVVLCHRVHVDALRERFDVTGPARLTGGAARSSLWAQMFADALDLEMEIPDAAESGARGAALLAGRGIGWFSSLEETAETVTIARRHRPDPERRKVLDNAYERFVLAANEMQEIWPQLAGEAGV